MPRETLLHAGHCKLLHDARLMGAIVFLPVPAFCDRPASVEDLIDHTVGRVPDLFDTADALHPCR